MGDNKRLKYQTNRFTNFKGSTAVITYMCIMFPECSHKQTNTQIKVIYPNDIF
jgi:hypothetical protein